MNKLKRCPDSYGWTDHTYRRQYKWIIGDEVKNRPLKHRILKRRGKQISAYNSMLFHKKLSELPF